MQKWTVFASVILFGCTGLTPYEPGADFEPKDDVDTDTGDSGDESVGAIYPDNISLEWNGQVAYLGDTLTLTGDPSGDAFQGRLFTLTLHNHNDADLELDTNPGIFASDWSGQAITHIEQPEAVVYARSSATFKILIPYAEEPSSGAIGFAWGASRYERFYAMVSLPGYTPAVEPPPPETLITAGRDGVFAISQDGGETWRTSWPDDDGGEFTRPNQYVHEWREVVFTGKRMLLIGREGNHSGTQAVIWESVDGTNWSTVPTHDVANRNPTSGVTLDSGLEVLISGRSAYISNPGEPDIRLTYEFEDSAQYRTVTAVATDGAQATAVKETDHFLTTVDGVNWTKTGQGLEKNELYDIIYASHRFVAVGSDHRAVLSTDGGATWQESEKVRDGEDKFTHKCARPDTWCQIRWDGGQFIVYERGRDDIGPAMRWTSPDAIAWTGEAITAERIYEAGEPSRKHESFMEWEVSRHTGAVVALEHSNKTVEDNAIRPLYYSADGLTFTAINNRIDGNPILNTLGAGSITFEEE